MALPRLLEAFTGLAGFAELEAALRAPRATTSVAVLPGSADAVLVAALVAVVLVVALATTYLPARQASKVYAAEALRYQ